jgi:hypothetical protein
MATAIAPDNLTSQVAIAVFVINAAEFPQLFTLQREFDKNSILSKYGLKPCNHGEYV